MEEGGRGGGGQDSRRSKRKDVDNDKVVFVGNVNFDATEEQLMSIFSQVGAVASLRLKYDRETGKPLGFGFVEVRRKKNYGFVFWFLFLFFFFSFNSFTTLKALLLRVAISTTTK